MGGSYDGGKLAHSIVFRCRSDRQVYCATFIMLGVEIPAKLTVLTYSVCVFAGMCMYVRCWLAGCWRVKGVS